VAGKDSMTMPATSICNIIHVTLQKSKLFKINMTHLYLHWNWKCNFKNWTKIA